MTDVWPLEVTPPRGHEVIEKLRGEIGVEALPIEVKRSSKLRPVGNCYWNVDAAIKQSGGSMVLGWAIMWWPNLYGVAMHHAVWQRPGGKLLDITESQPPDQRSKYTLFIRDERFKVDLTQGAPCIENRWVAENPSVDRLIALKAQQMATFRQLQDLYRKGGYRNGDNFAKALGMEPPPGSDEISLSPIDEQRVAGLTIQIVTVNKQIDELTDQFRFRL